jgi:hypothetical protein
MANKKTLLAGMLVVVLAFAMALIGCGDGDGIFGGPSGAGGGGGGAAAAGITGPRSIVLQGVYPHQGKQVVVNLYVHGTDNILADPLNQIAIGDGIVGDSNFLNIPLWATMGDGGYANAAGNTVDSDPPTPRARLTNTSPRVVALGPNNDRYIVMLQLGDIDGYYNALMAVLTKAAREDTDENEGKIDELMKDAAVAEAAFLADPSNSNRDDLQVAVQAVVAWNTAFEAYIDADANILKAAEDSSVTSIDYKQLWFTAGQRIEDLVGGNDLATARFPNFIFTTASRTLRLDQFAEPKD